MAKPESRTIAVIQARLASMRLPGKVIADLGGHPILAHVTERVFAAPVQFTAVILTTPVSDLAVLWPAAGKFRFRILWREHIPPDLLSTFVSLGDWAGANAIVRITADCPLLDPVRIGEALALQMADGLDYVALLDPPGMDIEVMTSRGLRLAAAAASASKDREHVGLAVWEALRRTGPAMTWAVIPAAPTSPWLAVDTAEDLARVRRVHAALEDPTDYSMAATLRGWEKAGRP